ncbi:MAG: hypothetical protein ABIK18_04035, partial [candidate division WOR-3 bacterium]
CLEFWWFASTCRHLGIGGKHKDHKVWEAHKKAMKDYLRLKEFYTQGIFYGLSETVHVHTLPERQQAVINLFNLCDQPHTKTITFELQEIGLNPKLRIQIIGAQYAQRGSKVTLNLNMLPRSARLVELKVP